MIRIINDGMTTEKGLAIAKPRRIKRFVRGGSGVGFVRAVPHDLVQISYQRIDINSMSESTLLYILETSGRSPNTHQPVL